MKRHEFDCARCGYKVFKRQDEFDHDHCPECLWSLHTNFSTVNDKPCFAVMRPIPCTWKGLWPGDDCEMMWEYCMKCTYICLQPVPYIATLAARTWLTGQTDEMTADWLDPFNEGRGAAIWTMQSRLVAGKPAFKWYRRTLRDETYDGAPFAQRHQFDSDLKRAGGVRDPATD